MKTLMKCSVSRQHSHEAVRVGPMVRAKTAFQPGPPVLYMMKTTTVEVLTTLV